MTPLWKSWLIWKKDDEEDFHDYWDKQKVPDDDTKIIYEGDEEESYDLDEDVEKASLFKSYQAQRGEESGHALDDDDDDYDDDDSDDDVCPTCGRHD